MRRRDFLKSGLLSAASVGAIHVSESTQGQGGGNYVEGQKLNLSNQYLEWHLVMTGGTVRSTGIRNKLSGGNYELSDSEEVLLTFSQAKARIEIPWWHYEMGPDNDTTPPESEPGYLKGYHLESFSADETWARVQNLYRRGAREVGQGYRRVIGGVDIVQDPSPVFNGYTWFRQWFELPKEAEGEQLAFCLGGYNQEDWSKYWVYVNGALIGHWTSSGRWRIPKELTLLANSPEYGKLRFGSGRKNLIAIRAYKVDKRFEGLSEEILDRFIFDGRLVDQFIAVGQPYLDVRDFKLNSWGKEGASELPRHVFELMNAEEQLQVTLYFELEGFLRRKWIEVKNLGPEDRLLLDVYVDDFRLQAKTTEGDFGYPVIIGEEMFCALEHPAGLNQGMGERVRLVHFPGKKLAAGASLRSQVSIFGVGPKGDGRQQFLNYIQARSPRDRLISIYYPLGINGFPDDPCWTLNDDEMLATMDLLEKWQKKGMRFDYYVPDAGWHDRTGDLTRFWPHCFPEGPEKVIRRANELGMKWGLWFPSTKGDWSCGLNPKVEPSRIPVLGDRWPEFLYRDGFDDDDERRQLCLASEPYFSTLRDALLYHIRHYNLRFWKLDAGSYYCNSSEHQHLPGKYSTEANFNAVLEIARAAHEAASDLYTMGYGGLRSPFFLLHGDSVFKHLSMEAASTGDYPALFFRDAVTLALDQEGQFAWFIPPMSKDSLGVWITDTWWGNSMKKERWREALVMDLGRGNLLFPQIWGDIFSLTEDDVEFLARMQALAKENETILYKRTRILGDPWKNETYGYAYFQGAHGFVFMNNVDFPARRVSLKLDETIGLRAPANTPFKLRAHFPDQAELQWSGSSVFKSGQTIETWLRPFEVAMWEVVPAAMVRTSKGWAQRELPKEKADVESHRLRLEAEPVGPHMEIHFADPDPHFRSPMRRPTLRELNQMGYRKRIIAQSSSLPALETSVSFLAFVLRLRKDGKWWRHRQLADLIQMKATIGDQTIRFEAVPNFKQCENHQWCPWLVFRTRISRAWSNKELRVAINAHLPPEVECQIDAWVIPKWWA